MPKACPYIQAILTHLPLHLGYFDPASFYSIYILYIIYTVKLLIVKGGQDHFPFRRTRYHENFPLIS